jgi:hypothetical protein
MPLIIRAIGVGDASHKNLHQIKRNMFQRIRWTTVLAVLTVAGAAGCSMPKASDLKPSMLFSLDSAWPWGDDEELEIQTPVRMVGLWTDTVLHNQGEKSQRGFGGRLIFYAQDGNDPVAVDGELVVYAFDETGREQTDNKPTRRYVFPADQVALHQSPSPLGPSYSFWLPWDEAGGPQTEVSLICRFQPKEGALVTSEQTRHRLPGVVTLDSALASRAHPKLPEGVPSRPARPDLPSHSIGLAATGGAQQASYESLATAGAPNAMQASMSDVAEPERRMTATSIDLPPNYKLPTGSVPPRIVVQRPADQPAPVVPIVIQLPPSGIPAQDGVQGAPAGQMQTEGSLSAISNQLQQSPTLPAAYSPMNAGHMLNQRLQRTQTGQFAQSPPFHPQKPQPQQPAVPMQAAGTAAVSYR